MVAGREPVGKDAGKVVGGRKKQRGAAGGGGSESGRSKNRDGDGRKHGRRWQSLEGDGMQRETEGRWRGGKWREAMGGGGEADGQGGSRNSIKSLADKFIEQKTILLEFIIATPIALVRQNGFY